MGRKIKAGSLVAVNVAAIHMSTEFWENPRAFLPERFAKEDTQENKRHPFAYIPFLAGPRNCIGKKNIQN